MKLLHGIKAPEGNGIILEVHLDIQKAPGLFLDWVKSKGFENDPFVIFYPPQYLHHMTGRTRLLPKQLSETSPRVEMLVEEVVNQARLQGVRLYTETELARETVRFPRN